jgi:hypothetical protein
VGIGHPASELTPTSNGGFFYVYILYVTWVDFIYYCDPFFKGDTMAKEEPCDCIEYERKLAECKESKHKECEEKTKEQNTKIMMLEKRIMGLTIVVVIAATLMGKQMMDKVMNIFDDVETIQQKIGETVDKKNVDAAADGSDGFRE